MEVYEITQSHLLPETHSKHDFTNFGRTKMFDTTGRLKYCSPLLIHIVYTVYKGCSKGKKNHWNGAPQFQEVGQRRLLSHL